jgi:hypothetical protein
VRLNNALVVALCVAAAAHAGGPNASLSGAIARWQAFERAVRDGALEKTAARAQLPGLMADLKAAASAVSWPEPARWVFPVAGHGPSSIGGKNGDGFLPHNYYGKSSIKGYDFFDGNKHGGHPAHDIFIRDRDQDGNDDATRAPVNAVAVVDALVVSVDTGWTPESALRGGNVVWLYNPRLNAFFYYAHLARVDVKPGERVGPGAPLGTLGRTGVSAHEKRSPTHLHLMVLRYDGKTLSPYNFYSDLAR